MKSMACACVVAAAVLGMSGCAYNKSGGTSNTVQASAGMVNSRCPMMPDHPLGGKKMVTTAYNGKTVGFCCAGCVPEWNKLSDAEKQARLVASK
jgi:hypothetical protein